MGKTKEQREQEEFEEVTHNGFLVLFFIVAMIVIGALCFIAGMVYSSYLNINEGRIEEKIKDKEKEKSDGINEKLVEDSNVIEELVKKKEVLLESSHRLEIYNFLKNDISVKGVSDDVKLSIALSLVNNNKSDKYIKEEIMKSITEKDKEYMEDYTGEYIDIDELDKVYYDYWGEKPKKYKTIQMAWRYIYIKDLNIYVMVLNGGNVVTTDHINSYDYTVTEDDYNYYLYTAVGVVSDVGIVYNDMSLYDIRGNNKEYTTFDKDDEYEINETNYDEFSKYKITFKKASKNKIFFSKIERVQ